MIPWYSIIIGLATLFGLYAPITAASVVITGPPFGYSILAVTAISEAIRGFVHAALGLIQRSSGPFALHHYRLSFRDILRTTPLALMNIVVAEAVYTFVDLTHAPGDVAVIAAAFLVPIIAAHIATPSPIRILVYLMAAGLVACSWGLMLYWSPRIRGYAVLIPSLGLAAITPIVLACRTVYLRVSFPTRVPVIILALESAVGAGLLGMAVEGPLFLDGFCLTSPVITLISCRVIGGLLLDSALYVWPDPWPAFWGGVVGLPAVFVVGAIIFPVPDGTPVEVVGAVGAAVVGLAMFGLAARPEPVASTPVTMGRLLGT